MRQQIITGIDIGNHAVKTVIAELNRDTSRPQVVGVGISPSNGLRKGTVFDMEETIRNISDSVSQAESTSGTKVDRAYISLNGLHVRNQLSKGVIVVSRADNEITQNDINRVIDAASTINLPPNREIITRFPEFYH